MTIGAIGVMRHGVTRGRWSVILEGDLRSRTESAIRDIAEALEHWTPNNPSLSHGSAGFAVFYGYLAKAGFADGKTASKFLDHAIDGLASVPMGASLYAGFTGIGWTVSHLQRLRGEIVDENANEAIDDALLDYVKHSPWNGDYDLVSGLVGLGVYAVDQLPTPRAVACLSEIVERLDELAQRTRDGITWLTRPRLLPDWQREICPRGYYNVGLAHGVPGVIAFLGRVCAQDRQPSRREASDVGGKRVSANERERINRSLPAATQKKARALLDGSVGWLLANKRPDNTNGFFPGWVGPDVELRPGRVAWCYGDLGVAVALLLVARCVNQTDWENAAIEVAKDVARRPVGQSRVVDAPLCHGAAGVGHLFNRLFHATGDALFKDTARLWFKRALNMRRKGEGVAGFSAVQIHPERGEYHIADPGLLEGAAGIGLALLAATTNVEPAWDRMLLASVPPR